MTFEKFMSLEAGDGVIYEGHIATVTGVTTIAKGEVINGLKAQHNIRELELSYVDSASGRMVKVFPKVYTDLPDEAHNRTTLRKMSEWDPFLSLR